MSLRQRILFCRAYVVARRTVNEPTARMYADHVVLTGETPSSEGVRQVFDTLVQEGLALLAEMEGELS